MKRPDPVGVEVPCLLNCRCRRRQPGRRRLPYRNAPVCGHPVQRQQSGSDRNKDVYLGSLVKKRRKKMSKHKYRKRIKANRHKKKQ